MKNPVRTLFAVVLAAGAALFAQAQTQKVLVVDIAKIYDGHYKTEEQNAKLKVDEQKATEELDRLNKEGNALVEQFKDLREKASNPAATADAKAKLEADAQKKAEEIQHKQEEVNQFRGNTSRFLQQRINNFRSLLLDEITKLSTDIAKKKGAALLLDKSGPSYLGIPVVVFSDSSLDITDEVMAEINKGRPAAPAASVVPAPAAQPAAAPVAAPAGSPDIKVQVPGAKK